jgi:nucleotide-binding universal stress UspA family protein
MDARDPGVEWEGQLMTSDMFQKILVTDDGSPEGERAASLGLRLAAKLQAEVVLFGVFPPVIFSEARPSEDPSIRRRKMEERFGTFLILGRSLDVEMTIEIVEGWAAKQIRKRAKADKVDLVIVGQSNLHRIRQWFTGSISEAVLRETTCSVMVVR